MAPITMMRHALASGVAGSIAATWSTLLAATAFTRNAYSLGCSSTSPPSTRGQMNHLICEVRTIRRDLQKLSACRYMPMPKNDLQHIMFVFAKVVVISNIVTLIGSVGMMTYLENNGYFKEDGGKVDLIENLPSA